MAVALLHAQQVVQVLLHEAAVVEAGEAVGGAEPLELARAGGEDVPDGVGLHRAEQLGQPLDHGQGADGVDPVEGAVQLADHGGLEHGQVAHELLRVWPGMTRQLRQLLRPLERYRRRTRRLRPAARMISLISSGSSRAMRAVGSRSMSSSAARSTTRMSHALAISPRDSSRREIGESTARFPSAAKVMGGRDGAWLITSPTVPLPSDMQDTCQVGVMGRRKAANSDLLRPTGKMTPCQPS